VNREPAQYISPSRQAYQPQPTYTNAPVAYQPQNQGYVSPSRQPMYSNNNNNNYIVDTTTRLYM